MGEYHQRQFKLTTEDTEGPQRKENKDNGNELGTKKSYFGYKFKSRHMAQQKVVFPSVFLCALCGKTFLK